MRILDYFMNLLAPTTWFIDIEYSKHGGTYYPKGPKSNRHKGTQVANEYRQLIRKQRNCPSFKEISDTLQDCHPNMGNWRILKIQKL